MAVAPHAMVVTTPRQITWKRRKRQGTRMASATGTSKQPTTTHLPHQSLKNPTHCRAEKDMLVSATGHSRFMTMLSLEGWDGCDWDRTK